RPVVPNRPDGTASVFRWTPPPEPFTTTVPLARSVSGASVAIVSENAPVTGTDAAKAAGPTIPTPSARAAAVARRSYRAAMADRPLPGRGSTVVLASNEQ